MLSISYRKFVQTKFSFCAYVKYEVYSEMDVKLLSVSQIRTENISIDYTTNKLQAGIT